MHFIISQGVFVFDRHEQISPLFPQAVMLPQLNHCSRNGSNISPFASTDKNKSKTWTGKQHNTETYILYDTHTHKKMKLKSLSLASFLLRASPPQDTHVCF